MKMLKKIALVSAISAISAGAFAMEAMDDETMATTTGQDGITINIVPDAISRTNGSNGAVEMGVSAATMDAISPSAPLYKGLSIGEIRVHDDDGLGVLGTDATANSGALVIGGGASGAGAAARHSVGHHLTVLRGRLQAGCHRRRVQAGDQRGRGHGSGLRQPGARQQGRRGRDRLGAGRGPVVHLEWQADVGQDHQERAVLRDLHAHVSQPVGARGLPQCLARREQGALTRRGHGPVVS